MLSFLQTIHLGFSVVCDSRLTTKALNEDLRKAPQ